MTSPQPVEAAVPAATPTPVEAAVPAATPTPVEAAVPAAESKAIAGDTPAATAEKDDGNVVPPKNSNTTDELIAIEKLAEQLVQREPASLPHRTLLALARLKQHRPIAALEVYSNIQVTPNALSPSALAVHAAVLNSNGKTEDAHTEAKQIKVENLLPEERMLIQQLL
jgi:hypothetical protein